MKRRYIPLILLALLGLSQFIKIDKTNPTVVNSEDFITAESPANTIAERLKSTCYDCHSNETRYPWYTDVAPVSWWVKKHINAGRKHLNFSVWGQYESEKKAHKMEEAIEYTHKKWMPLGSYKWMHPEAKMTAEQRSELVEYFKEIKAKY